MSTIDSTEAALSSSRLGTTVIGVGLLAATGSILVALGLTDVLSYVEGYRPNHWIVVSYLQAFLVTAVGWSLLAGAALGVGRAIRSGT